MLKCTPSSQSHFGRIERSGSLRVAVIRIIRVRWISLLAII